MTHEHEWPCSGFPGRGRKMKIHRSCAPSSRRQPGNLYKEELSAPIFPKGGPVRRGRVAVWHLKPKTSGRRRITRTDIDGDICDITRADGTI